MSRRVDGAQRHRAVRRTPPRRLCGAALLVGVIVLRGGLGAAWAEPVVALDGRQLRVTFEVVTAGVWRVAGRFNDVRGEIVVDARRAADRRVRVVARTSSIDTGLAIRDDRLRSGDLLDAEGHPTMIFDSTSFEPRGSGEGRLVGNLGLRGIVRPISLDYVVSCPRAAGEGAGPASSGRLAAKGMMRRSEWGMNALIPMVSDEIQLEIEADLPHPVCRRAFASAGQR